MRSAFSKVELETEIASRFGSAFELHEKPPAEVLSSGIPQIDAFAGGGLPRGAITEIFGPASSGRTSSMVSSLAYATMHEEVCALVDTNNVFDPDSAARAEINFERLLWIRCDNNLEHAFKATDLLLQAGGFGLVMIDLGNVPGKDARRIISSWWYRFRRILEATPTVLVVIAEESCAKSCAALALELTQETGLWTSNCATLKAPEFITPALTARRSRRFPGKESPIYFGRVKSRVVNFVPLPHVNLLQGLQFQVECQRPLHLTRRDEEVRVKVCNANR